MARKKKQVVDETRELAAAVLALVRARDRTAVTETLQSELGLSKTKAARLVRAAMVAIADAAETDVRSEIGQAKIRLEDIYTASMEIGQPKIALDALRERNKLLSLYEQAETSAISDAVQSERDVLIRAALESCPEVSKGLPLEELARQVAQLLADDERLPKT